MPGKQGVKTNAMGRVAKVLTKKPQTVRELANKLNVSPETVYYHKDAITKLKGVKAVVLGAEDGHPKPTLAFARK